MPFCLRLKTAPATYSGTTQPPPRPRKGEASTDFGGGGSACRLGPPTSPDSSACLRLAFQRNCNRKKLERGSRSDGGQRRKAFRLGLDDPGNSLPPLHSKSHLGVLRGRAKGNSRLLFDFFTWWFLPSSRDVTVSRACPSPLHTASVARAIYSPQLPFQQTPAKHGTEKVAREAAANGGTLDQLRSCPQTPEPPLLPPRG